MINGENVTMVWGGPKCRQTGGRADAVHKVFNGSLLASRQAVKVQRNKQT